MQILYGSCAAVLCIALIPGLTTYCYTRLLGAVGQRFVFELRRDPFAHMPRPSLRFHDTQKTADLNCPVTSDIQTIQEFISNDIVTLRHNTLFLRRIDTPMFWL